MIAYLNGRCNTPKNGSLWPGCGTRFQKDGTAVAALMHKRRRWTADDQKALGRPNTV
jgi:hypothetical protein